MKLSRTLLIKGIAVGIEVINFFLKKDLTRYNTTIIDVMDTGKDVGLTVLTTIKVFQDSELSPEEILELAEKLTSNKRNLDKVLTTLIKDLKDHAISKTKEGNIFNWREMTGDVLRIRSISEKPQESFVEIFYRNAWFYIHDSDLSSKSTFALLGQIFSLQAGKIEDNAPFLTLPIGQ